MRIRHHGDSGLFPGDYEQKLQWRKGGVFDLVVTKKNPVMPSSPGSICPDFHADGSKVVARKPDRSLQTEALEPAPNDSPGWEVSGGLIIGWLQRTWSSKMVLDGLTGPNGEKVVFQHKWGARQSWRGMRVTEIDHVNEGAASEFLMQAGGGEVHVTWDGIAGFDEHAGQYVLRATALVRRHRVWIAVVLLHGFLQVVEVPAAGVGLVP